MKDQYRNVLHEIMTEGDIDRLIRCTHGKERRFLKGFKNTYNEIVSINRYEEIPIWITLMQIESQLLLKEILTLMVLHSEPFLDKEDYYD